MIDNEILKEKSRVQKILAESATDIHDYFVNTQKDAKQFMEEYGYSISTKKPADFKEPIKSDRL